MAAMASGADSISFLPTGRATQALRGSERVRALARAWADRPITSDVSLFNSVSSSVVFPKIISFIVLKVMGFAPVCNSALKMFCLASRTCLGVIPASSICFL